MTRAISLAGLVFVKQALGPAISDTESFAPYAAFGGFYFLVSAVALAIRRRRALASPA